MTIKLPKPPARLWCAGILSVALALTAAGCQAPPAKSAATPEQSAVRLAAYELPSDEARIATEISFFSSRLQRDPEDFSALNKLAGRFLQRARATNDFTYIARAERAARASLASVPAVRNSAGLALLAQIEFTSHEFAKARDHARQLTKLDAGKSEPYAMLGDALLELGDYAPAKAAFQKMSEIGPGNIGTETRLARLALLQGRNEEARRHYFNALALTLDLPTPPRETVAWCRWQLGETAFVAGDLKSAEKYYHDALTTYPDYYRALASLGRVLAAKGNLDGAIARYQEAARVVPDPTFLAALGDLYHLAKREREAQAAYELAELSATAPAGGGNVAAHRRLHSRQLAIFLADHNLKPQQAYAMARGEYATRRDIYGADALAWTALKANHLPQAQAAIKDALRLGTRDAKLFYHAGMIARAAGDAAGARQYLQRALDLNAHFDPLQAELARKALND